MASDYTPPFHMTEEITNLIIEIGEYVGSISTYESMHTDPVLRRENRIKSVQSSLAIEHNTLTVEQITDIIDGKRVLGPPQDIHEAKNAYEAYEMTSRLNPYSVKDLLKAHRIMMNGLVTEAGMFRSKNVGVYAGTQLIHAGTPANYVPGLMKDLFDWMKKSKYHPLVKSCIFHYEFEFIHPFADGNGRTGRLWQSLILQKWKPLFAWMPIETLVHKNQNDYYKALQLANNAADSTIFVEFMLKIIRDALIETVQAQDKIDSDVVRNVGVNVVRNVVVNDERILELLKHDGKLTAAALASTLGLTERQVQRIMAKLKVDNRLIRHGSSKNGWWEVQD